MISYYPNNHPKDSYVFSFESLRADFERFRRMSDDEFRAGICDVLHFACYVCFIKEKRSERVLVDDGIIHELIHVLCEERNQARGDEHPEVSATPLKTIRALFNKECCLT